VSAVLAYLVSRGKKAGPLFIFKDSDALRQAGVVWTPKATWATVLESVLQ